MGNDDLFADALVIDHLRAIRDQEYAAEISHKIKEITATPGFKPVQALHEHDNSCCRIQQWEITSSHIMADTIAGMTGDASENVQAKLAEHQPSILLVGGKPPVAEENRDP